MEQNANPSCDRPNLYLVGFMGTGKSTLGRRLAQVLGLRFLDSDAVIEKNVGMKISDIFDKLGEPAFREMEREFIESGHPDSGCVVACGGGLVCRDSMPEIVRQKGVCIALFSSPAEIYERIKGGKNRPLLNLENPIEKISELSAARTPFYLRSGISILVDRELDVTQERIVRVYESECQHRKNTVQK